MCDSELYRLRLRHRPRGPSSVYTGEGVRVTRRTITSNVVWESRNESERRTDTKRLRIMDTRRVGTDGEERRVRGDCHLWKVYSLGDSWGRTTVGDTILEDDVSLSMDPPPTSPRPRPDHSIGTTGRRGSGLFLLLSQTPLRRTLWSKDVGSL